MKLPGNMQCVATPIRRGLSSAHSEEESDDSNAGGGSSGKHVGPRVELNCSGCGATLQTLDPSVAGFIPRTKLEDYLSTIEANADKHTQVQETISQAKHTGRSPLHAASETKREVETEKVAAKDFQPVICQRCFSLKHYNTALNITLKADDYIHHLSHLKDKRALILLMIDVVDFPGSLFPNLSSLIPPTSLVFIVANKIDLLPEHGGSARKKLEAIIVKESMQLSLDSCKISKVDKWTLNSPFGFVVRLNCFLDSLACFALRSIQAKVKPNSNLNRSLVDSYSLNASANGESVRLKWKHLMGLFYLWQVHFISAKTGEGVESLTESILKYWGNRGDVYLLGCTNVGKSSLFNSLLTTLCGARPGELTASSTGNAPSATISRWPGTTLGLLSFPIMSMGKRQRLLAQARKRKATLADRIGDWKDVYTVSKDIGIDDFISDQQDVKQPVKRAFSETEDVLVEIGLKKAAHKDVDMEVEVVQQLPQDRFRLYDTPGAINDAQVCMYKIILISCCTEFGCVADHYHLHGGLVSGTIVYLLYATLMVVSIRDSKLLSTFNMYHEFF